MADDNEKFLEQLRKEKEMFENSKKGLRDLGKVEARYLPDMEKQAPNLDAALSSSERGNKRFGDLAKLRRERGDGRTGFPQYDSAVKDEFMDEVLEKRKLDPANRFTKNPGTPKPVTDYMEKAKRVASDMEKVAPERIPNEKAALGKALMERAKDRGRSMDRKAWTKDGPAGDSFTMKNRDILKTPEATKKLVREGVGNAGKLGILKKIAKGAAGGIGIGGLLGLLSGDASASSAIPLLDSSESAGMSSSDEDTMMAEIQAMKDYDMSPAKRDKMIAMSKRDPEDKALDTLMRRPDPRRGEMLLEKGVNEKLDPMTMSNVRNALADPEESLLKNPDRKIQAAEEAKKRLAREMFKRNILPKVRE